MVHIGGKGAYVVRVETVASYAEVSRDLANTTMAGIHGHPLTEKHNFVAESVETGNKSTIGGGCIVGEGTSLGEKSSIKRSVIGAGCQLGNNVKVVNSVLMDGCTVEDGCHVQNCIVCPRVTIQTKCSLKDCKVGQNYSVAAGSDLREEVLVMQL
mmetsp:Transcript_10109/g.28417  ORF Transcript_10109/g.28417 Transcript_10109/m.28417 type:complete len:155 (+) Transcript_10109:1-465(+)